MLKSCGFPIKASHPLCMQVLFWVGVSDILLKTWGLFVGLCFWFSLLLEGTTNAVSVCLICRPLLQNQGGAVTSSNVCVISGFISACEFFMTYSCLTFSELENMFSLLFLLRLVSCLFCSLFFLEKQNFHIHSGVFFQFEYQITVSELWICSFYCQNGLLKLCI